MKNKDDNYDELLVLARDARSTRKRTNYWTTGLIVTGMAASTVYVATVNQQLDALKDASETAEAGADDREKEIDRLNGVNNALRSERDAYENVAAWFSKMVPELKVADGIERIVISTGTAGRDGVDGSNDFALSNLVWYVDGSRRFPVAARDILWIPEGQFWVQLEASPQDVAPRRITVHLGEDRPASDPQTPADSPLVEGPFDLARPASTTGTPNPPYPYYQRKVTRGAMNCVQIKLESQTQRPAFSNGYADMIVTYLNSSSCDNGFFRQ